jgi:hypothetical protein
MIITTIMEAFLRQELPTNGILQQMTFLELMQEQALEL